MQTAKEITDALIAQSKKMDIFMVKTPVEDNWLPQGTVPFDVHVANNIATMKVLAETQEEAERIVAAFMEEQ